MRGNVMGIKNVSQLDLVFYLLDKVIIDTKSFSTLMKLSILLRDQTNFKHFWNSNGVLWLAQFLRQNTVFLEDSGVSKCINALLEAIIINLE